MKAPVPLPFVKRGEDIPPSGVSLQAVLGFLVPFLLIAATALITYFVIRAGLSGGGEGEEAGAILSLLLG